MKKAQILKELNEILAEAGIDVVLTSLKNKGARSKYGEIHANYFALYGNFTTAKTEKLSPLKYKNETVFNADQADQIQKILQDAGYPVLVHSLLTGAVNKRANYEILIEIDQYYMGSSDKREYDFTYRESIDRSQFSCSYKYGHYKIVNC